MRRALLAAACALAASGAGAVERLGVMAVADAPAGPDAELTELAHQLRAACRDRVGGVEEVATMRRRLLGQGSDATLSELDRAYGGALAVYQNGEFDSSVRTLRAIVDDLEAVPEGEEAFFQWKRAMLRLAHASLSLGQEREMERAFLALARTDPALQPDPDQYSPGFRRRFEEVKARVRALPRRRLHVASEGRSGTVYVNGRAMGTTPLTLTLPAGSYRVGGGAGALRVPSFTVDLESEDRSVVLDFALAEALRVNAGPGLALAPEARGYGIVRAGAWLGVDRLLTVSRAQEGQAQFLVGSIFDVRRGALLREGSVRLVAGGLPSVQVGALASFLLTGQSSRDVQNLTQQGPREIRPPLPPVAELRPVPAASPPAVVAALASAPTPAVATGAAAPASAATLPAVRPPAARATGAAPAPISPAVLPPTAAAAATAATAHASATPAPTSAPPVAQTPAPTSAPPVAQTPAPTQMLAAANAPAPVRSILAPAPRAALPALDPAGRALGAGSRPGVAPRWMRPAAIGSGALALGLAAVAVQQGLAASGRYADARDMLGADGQLLPGSDPGRYRDLRSGGDSARRNAFVSAGVAAAFAATAGVLGWLSWDGDGDRDRHADASGGLSVRF
ncbi:conserved hypothetical protein [Anaeromyxobacter dehalogenans 2CP-1]|uniref:PEGA domain-containing protein n=1 Tax=Anaeromyxobacter dehalogenans (strain ATCC BAA-258 / DSM 21875 / 2CP-1) TaxID=455488 RepID=B8JBS3_ANAD2|nr:PEGA domain-containing protein [Anaeromyxobacter dehalogenans]ACL67681.1 conserved hypothetical protein [Anaeromyxobacter dehalogenans 2CP-1]